MKLSLYLCQTVRDADTVTRFMRRVKTQVLACQNSYFYLNYFNLNFVNDLLVRKLNDDDDDDDDDDSCKLGIKYHAAADDERFRTCHHWMDHNLRHIGVYILQKQE